MSDTDYIPSPSRWVREQVEKIEATGDTRSVHIMNLPVVMLTMRGKKTGGIRKVPLMRVEHDGVYAAVASKGGAPEHPQWYGNLRANPSTDSTLSSFSSDRSTLVPRLPVAPTTTILMPGLYPASGRAKP